MSEVEIITVSKKGQIVLPKKIRSNLKISQGSKLFLVEEKGEISLKKIEDIIKKKKSKTPLTMLASEKALVKDRLFKEDEAAWKKIALKKALENWDAADELFEF